MAVLGRGGDGRPRRPLCLGAVLDCVPKAAVVLVKSSPVDPSLYLLKLLISRTAVILGAFKMHVDEAVTNAIPFGMKY